jgi:hypothetical protein
LGPSPHLSKDFQPCAAAMTGRWDTAVKQTLLVGSVLVCPEEIACRTLPTLRSRKSESATLASSATGHCGTGERCASVRLHQNWQGGPLSRQRARSLGQVQFGDLQTLTVVAGLKPFIRMMPVTMPG